MGVFYKIILSQSICKKIENNYKILMSMISILICAKINGNVNLKPLAIVVSKKPVCFKNFILSISVNSKNSRRE